MEQFSACKEIKETSSEAIKAQFKNGSVVKNDDTKQRRVSVRDIIEAHYQKK